MWYDRFSAAREPQEVVGLTLRVNGLLGTLPASLAQLTHLTMLDLLDNRLRGTLPADAFAQLGALQHLNLYNNDMSWDRCRTTWA